MFFVTGPAPRSVLYARVVVPVLLVFAYVALRVVPVIDGRIPWYEVVSIGLAIVGLTVVSLLAVVDLAFAPLIAAAGEGISALEITAEISGIRDIDDAVAQAYHDGMGHPADDDVAPGPLVRRGAMIVAEPTLITHEYEAIHHTPARGIQLGIDPASDNEDSIVYAYYTAGRMVVAHPPLTQTARTGTITGRLPSPIPRTPGRHRLNAASDTAQGTRERSGGFFGVFG